MENETLIQYMQIVVKWARLHTHEMMYECFAYTNISWNEAVLLIPGTCIDYVRVALPTTHFLFNWTYKLQLFGTFNDICSCRQRAISLVHVN